MSKQAYKFRLYPTKKQAQALTWTLDRARELYNAALQERRDAYRVVGKSITYYDQANQLPELSERWHSCDCGTELNRDHNAAINILRLGRSLQARAEKPRGFSPGESSQSLQLLNHGICNL